MIFNLVQPYFGIIEMNISGRPKTHKTQTEAIENYLNRYIENGFSEITIRKLRDNLKGIAVFNNVQGVHLLIKNEILPKLIKKGICKLEGTTIILKGVDL